MGYIDQALKFAIGRFFGTVYPPAPPSPTPARTGRSHCMNRLAEFLAAVEFSRTGDKTKEVVTFRIPRANIFTEMPDEPERLTFPAIAFVPGRARNESMRLGPPFLIESSYGVAGPSTGLLDLGEYTETFTIEVWSNNEPERAALKSGVELVFRLAQDSGSLRLSLPDYYGGFCLFSLQENMNVDDDNVVRGRRRGQVFVELRFQETVVVDVRTMQVQTFLDVTSPD